MSTSEKMDVIRQTNGALGGVKTPEGKEISRMNAQKHGVLSKLITTYDVISFETTYESFADEFGATTFSRKVLIEQLAITYVRLLRCVRYESDKIRETLNPPEYKIEPGPFDMSSLDAKTVLVAKNDQALLNASTLNELEPLYQRYEPQLFKRFIRLLERLGG